MKYAEVRAVGNYVVLKAQKAEDVKEVVRDSGIIVQAETVNANTSGQKVNTANGKQRVKPATIISLGPTVNKDFGLKIGDSVILNDYDCHSFTADDGEIYIVCKDSSIQCVVSCVEN